jgi:hypothetical protein
MPSGAAALQRRLLKSKPAPGTQPALSSTKRTAEEAGLRPRQGRLPGSPAGQAAAAPVGNTGAAPSEIAKVDDLTLDLEVADDELSVLTSDEASAPAEKDPFDDDRWLDPELDNLEDDPFENPSLDHSRAVVSRSAQTQARGATEAGQSAAKSVVMKRGLVPQQVVVCGKSIQASNSFEVPDKDSDNEVASFKLDNLELNAEDEKLVRTVESTVHHDALSCLTEEEASLSSGHGRSGVQAPASQQAAGLGLEQTQQEPLLKSQLFRGNYVDLDVKLIRHGYKADEIEKIKPENRLEVLNLHTKLNEFGFSHDEISTMSNYQGALIFLSNNYSVLREVLEFQKNPELRGRLVKALSLSRGPTRGAPLAGLKEILDVGEALKGPELKFTPKDLFELAMQVNTPGIKKIYSLRHSLGGILEEFKSFQRKQSFFWELIYIARRGGNRLDFLVAYFKTPADYRKLIPLDSVLSALKINSSTEKVQTLLMKMIKKARAKSNVIVGQS